MDPTHILQWTEAARLVSELNARFPLSSEHVWGDHPPEPEPKPVPPRCTARSKCQGEQTRYDEVSHGVYSLTLKCRACGFIVRHDWD